MAWNGSFWRGSQRCYLNEELLAQQVNIDWTTVSWTACNDHLNIPRSLRHQRSWCRGWGFPRNSWYSSQKSQMFLPQCTGMRFADWISRLHWKKWKKNFFFFSFFFPFQSYCLHLTDIIYVRSSKLNTFSWSQKWKRDAFVCKRSDIFETVFSGLHWKGEMLGPRRNVVTGVRNRAAGVTAYCIECAIAFGAWEKFSY